MRVSHNTIIGAGAMQEINNDSQSNCIAIGVNALKGNVSSDGDVSGAPVYSIAIGNDAMAHTNSRGSNFNIALGSGAMDSTFGGTITDSIAIGRNSMHHASNQLNGVTGAIGLGYASLQSLTTGDGNIAIGYEAGDTITTGAYNVYIGYSADASANNVSDEIVLKAGSDALVGGGTETIRIGVDSDYIVNDFGENATWTHSSDRRIKKNIIDNDLGLEFVLKLKTRKFQKKAPSEYPFEFEQHNPNTTERKNPDRIHYGFVAQEVKEAMDSVGHSEFPVWSKQEDGMELLGETELITPLVKAVQELSSENQKLKDKLNDLEIFIMDKLGDE